MNYEECSLHPMRDYGPATWTDLMQIREYRREVLIAKRELRTLTKNNANPMDIVHERIRLRGAQWRLQRLESKFELRPDYF